MRKHYDRSLFWILFFMITIGFLCNFFALVVPQWFARYPYARSPFICLGLWEICFDKYMPNNIGNVMYDGCFYIFESHLIPIWPVLFRGNSCFISMIFIFLAWFICCQVFQTFGFIAYIFTEGLMVMQAIRMVSIRGSRAVLFLLIFSTATCK